MESSVILDEVMIKRGSVTRVNHHLCLKLCIDVFRHIEMQQHVLLNQEHLILGRKKYFAHLVLGVYAGRGMG